MGRQWPVFTKTQYTYKTILDVKLGRCRVTTRKLENILVITASSFNNRQLHRPTESVSETVVTPHDLFMGRQSSILPAYRLGKDDKLSTLMTSKHVKKRIKYVDVVSTQLWRKFLFQCIYTLMSKPLQNGDRRRPPSVGDIMVLRDYSFFGRGMYPMVRVIKVICTRDDSLIISVGVIVRSGNNVIRSPNLVASLVLC